MYTITSIPYTSSPLSVLLIEYPRDQPVDIEAAVANALVLAKASRDKAFTDYTKAQYEISFHRTYNEISSARMADLVWNESLASQHYRTLRGWYRDLEKLNADLPACIAAAEWLTRVSPVEEDGPLNQ